MRKSLLIIILVAAAAIRLAHLTEIWDSVAVQMPIIDSEYYHDQAASLARGNNEKNDVYFMSPLYPWFLSTLYRLFGIHPQLGILFQTLLGIFLVYLIYPLGKRLFDEDVGLLAALLAAFYRPLIYYEGVLLSAILILIMNGIALLFLHTKKKRSLNALLAGILLGLSTLARPNVLLFVTLLILLLILKSSQYDLRRALFLFIGLFIILSPVAFQNYRHSGKFILPTAGMGMNFYAGNNPEAQGIYWEAPFIQSAEPEYEKEDYRAEASRRIGRELTVVETSQYWLKQGLNFALEQPIPFGILLLKKLFLFFHHTEIPNNLSLYGAREFSSILRWIPFSFGLLAPLGFAFWFLQFKKAELAIAHFYGLSYLLATLLFFAASEYRLPIILVLFPFTAAGIKVLFAEWKGAKWRSKVPIIALTVLFAVAINMPTRFTDEIQTPRMDYFNLGSVLQKHNHHREASIMLQKALICDPDFAEAHQLLGDSYHALKLREEAKEEFLRAGLDADKMLLTLDADELLDKARMQAHLGEYKDAWQKYAEAVSFHPNPPAFAYFNMAYLSLQLGDTSQALDELKLATEADTYEPRAPFLLGLIYQNRSQWELALEQFLLAMGLNPNFQLPRAHAALVCLEMGDKGQAAALIEPLVGKWIKEPELADLVGYVAEQVGYGGVRKR